MSTISNAYKQLQLFLIRYELLGMILIMVVAIGLSLGLYKLYFPGSFVRSHTAWAEFGSYIGGTLGAFFAFLAVVILLKTLHINKKELEETRAVLQKQNFDSTFLQLLSQVENTVDKVVTSCQKSTISGMANTLLLKAIIQRQSDIVDIRKFQDTFNTNQELKIIEPLLKLLELVLVFLLEDTSKQDIKDLHVSLFSNKLNNEIIIISVFYIVAFKPESSALKSIENSNYIMHLDDITDIDLLYYITNQSRGSH